MTATPSSRQNAEGRQAQSDCDRSASAWTGTRMVKRNRPE